MSTLTTPYSPLVEECPKPDPRHTSKPRRPDFGSHAADALQPNVLVRWAFYLSVFSIPFTQLYLPGTGERIGVTRLVQAPPAGARRALLVPGLLRRATSFRLMVHA
jgi:hypothetical protein